MRWLKRPDREDAPGKPRDFGDNTTLSWERTALTLLVVVAGVARHTWSTLGVAGLWPLVPLALLSVWVVTEGWRRYDDDRTSRTYRSIGGPTFVMAATTALVAGTEVVFLLRT